MSDAEQPGHLGAQFSDFSFRAGDTGGGYVQTVAYHQGKPVGSLSIIPHSKSDRVDNDYRQRRINKERFGHGTREVDEADVVIEKQLPGQMQWDGGNFDRDTPAHVGWLGLDTRLGSRATMAKVLSRMMSLGVAHHGSVPRADSELSEEGAAMSRGTARKYDMKAHPDNPRMMATFTNDYEEEEETSGPEVSVWRAENYARRPAGVNEKDYTAEEADAVHQRVDEAYHVNKRRPDEETEPEAFAAWQDKRNRRPVRGQMRLPGI